MDEDIKPDIEIGIDSDDPDNILLLNIFTLVYDQLIIGPTGPIALDMSVLPIVFDAYEITTPQEKKWIMKDLKDLTNGFINGE